MQIKASIILNFSPKISLGMLIKKNMYEKRGNDNGYR